MKVVTKRFLSGLALLFVAGCEDPTGVYTYKEGASVSQVDKDYFECELAATQQVPTDIRVGTTPVYTTPIQTSCYNYGYSTQCSTSGGNVYGGQSYTYDANADLRGEFLGRCMIARGYVGYELPNCNKARVPQSVASNLSGRLRKPAEGACYYPITEDAGNIVYTAELQ